MDFGLGSYGLGFLAGALSTLSPCVLPIIPILLGSAANAHPRAPLALATGLALSYAIIGSTLAWAGSSLGLDTSIFRALAAVLLGLIGVVLMSTSLQHRFASATSGIGDVGNRLLSGMALDGLWGQFVIGVVLGVVWSPCVGPTLGAAVVLASQGSSLPQVALVMGVFGLGAALPIVILGQLSREAINKAKGRLMLAGKTGKTFLGGALVVIAALILSGADKTLEAVIVEHSPGVADPPDDPILKVQILMTPAVDKSNLIFRHRPGMRLRSNSYWPYARQMRAGTPAGTATLATSMTPCRNRCLGFCSQDPGAKSRSSILVVAFHGHQCASAECLNA